VSTPIADVADGYADVVHLARGPRGFVAACERALGSTAAERARRQARADAVLARTSWDETVAAMEAIVDELGAARRGLGGASA
jgi:hypothetical protein